MKRVILYGLGKWIECHIIWLKACENIIFLGCADSDVKKAPKVAEYGLEYITAEELKKQNYDCIWITSVQVDEIKEYCQGVLGIKKEILSAAELYEEWAKNQDGQLLCLGDEYGDKKFTVLSHGDETLTTGLLSSFYEFIHRMWSVIEAGEIPVIDMMNELSQYHKDWHEVGYVNVWEMFFNQPSGYTMQDISHAKNVRLSFVKNPCPLEYAKQVNLRIIHDIDFRSQLHEIYSKYISLSERVEREYIEVCRNVFEKNVDKNDVVLGVTIRGTDYRKGKPHMHFIQPGIEEIIRKIKEVMRPWKITKIYVNSDEEESIRLIKDSFPGMVFSMDYQRYDNYKFNKKVGSIYSTIGNMRFDREDDEYRRGADYLMSTLLFTKCQCFIGGVAGGSTATLIMKGKFQHEYIYTDLGVYGIDEKAMLFTRK